MITRRLLLGLLAGCFGATLAMAAPEPTPKETQGRIVGKITKKDGSKITVAGGERELTLMPYWRGGMPANGGGFDKDMVRRLEEFKVGDRVRIKWEFEEHYRIVSIEKAGEAKAPGEKKEGDQKK
jgi:hypothetical protein